MTDRPIIFSAPMVRALLDGRKTMTRRLAWRRTALLIEPDVETWAPTPWQKVQPGDRLWVRENWYAARGFDDVKPRDMGRDWKICPAVDWNYADWGIKGKLRPAIHMPRWASRLTLVVTAAKIERLQDISAANAEAEGVFRHVAAHSLDKVFRSQRQTIAIEYFSALWAKLHGVESWQANPEVVALTFTVHQSNIDQDVPIPITRRKL